MPTASAAPSAAAAPESPLLPEHRAEGATLTSFAGWTMPLRFGSDLGEHRAVREAVGIFDLSHMAQLDVSGPGAAAALDRALVSVVSQLPVGRARYTMLTDARGGVLDDLVVYRTGESEFLVVANAANRLVVIDELTRRARGERAQVVDRTSHRALIALQGPRAERVLTGLVDTDLVALRYYAITTARVADVPALVARTGYTGEDGFELSVPASSAREVWRGLRAAGAASGLVPCGLASRDTLRLEAGMPLYGQELTADLTPYDAGLGRVVDLEHEFVGRAALTERARQDGGRALVGLRGTGRRAARTGCAVLRDGVPVGTVTSGALSPTLGHPIAIASVAEPLAAGTRVEVDVRGVRQGMEVVPRPFYRRPR
jgi:aminomethyltransferase